MRKLAELVNNCMGPWACDQQTLFDVIDNLLDNLCGDNLPPEPQPNPLAPVPVPAPQPAPQPVLPTPKPKPKLTLPPWWLIVSLRN